MLKQLNFCILLETFQASVSPNAKNESYLNELNQPSKSQPKFKHTETLFTNRAICIATWQKMGGKNSALAPGCHYRNERQKRLKRCDGGKEKKFTLLRWDLLMSLTPLRINSLINMYT